MKFVDKVQTAVVRDVFPLRKNRNQVVINHDHAGKLRVAWNLVLRYLNYRREYDLYPVLDYDRFLGRFFPTYEYNPPESRLKMLEPIRNIFGEEEISF